MSCAHEKAPAWLEGQTLGLETPHSQERKSMRKLRNRARVRNHWNLPLWRFVADADQGRRLTYPERCLARRLPIQSRAVIRLIAEFNGYRSAEEE